MRFDRSVPSPGGFKTVTTRHWDELPHIDVSQEIPSGDSSAHTFIRVVCIFPTHDILIQDLAGFAPRWKPQVSVSSLHQGPYSAQKSRAQAQWGSTPIRCYEDSTCGLAYSVLGECPSFQSIIMSRVETSPGSFASRVRQDCSS